MIQCDFIYTPNASQRVIKFLSIKMMAFADIKSVAKSKQLPQTQVSTVSKITYTLDS
jgi:hypothetical protein